MIDEVSMVRADLLDCIDRSLKKNRKGKSNQAFGGVQVIFVGDLFQLPPVLTEQDKKVFSLMYKSPYFFDSNVFQNLAFKYIELTKIYRQDDQDFKDILNKMRSASLDENDLEVINTRVDEFLDYLDPYYIYLTITNYLADKVNMGKLAQISDSTQSYEASVSGKFNPKHSPAPEKLTLKTGAQIMLLNNDSEGRWINGTIGIVDDFVKSDGEEMVIVTLENGITVEVVKNSWDLYKFTFNALTKQIEAEEIGSFSQYPMKLAWAITIHKSQGKTFEKVVIDIGSGTFVPGHLYVAFSRCTSLEGIILRRRVEKEHAWTDDRLDEFHKYLSTLT